MSMVGNHLRRRGGRILCRATSRVWVDSLEQRRMLAAAAIPEVWTIHGTAGNDEIAIGFADDECTQVLVSINDKEIGTRAASLISGFSIVCGNGDDNVFIGLDESHPIPATIDGGAGNDTIYSDWGNDSLIGGTGNDWLDGYYGSDTVLGGIGADELYGQGGDDSLDGGGGNDSIHAGEGDDWATGGAGNDALIGENGDDVLDGGAGSDDIYAGEGDDTAGGGAGNDDLIGNGGNDELNGDAGNDDIWGNVGDDTLGGDAGADDIYGGDGSDDMDGDAGNDNLDGGYGDDTLDGELGNDDLSGDAGNDSLSGDAGNDDLSGGAGIDDLDGDAGNDDLEGGAGDDNLAGGDGNDSLDGDAGQDQLSGDAGNDSLSGDAGNDSIAGDDGNDRVTGDTGNDSLTGDAGTDTVSGGSGDDEIRGGTGTDVLTGGAGMDIIFRWAGDKTNGDKYDQWRNDFRDSPVQSLADPVWVEQIRQSLIDQAVQRYSYYLGKDATAQTYEIRNSDGDLVYWNDVPWVNGEPYWYYWDYWYRCNGIDMAYTTTYTNSTSSSQTLSIDSNTTTDSPASTGDYSTTNNQVQGVEEGDIVQTDGQYIYLMSGRNIQIINAWPAEQTHEVASITLPNRTYGSALYLDGDRLTVVSTHYKAAPDRGEYSDLFGWFSYYGSTTTTDITVYDVADRSSPHLLGQTELDGYTSGSRDINGQLYVVTGNTLIAPEPEYQLTAERTIIDRPVAVDPVDETGEGQIIYWNHYYSQTPEDVYGHLPDGYGIYTVTARRTIESTADYRARLEALPIDSFLPQFTTTDAAGQTVASGPVAGIDRLNAQSKPASDASIFSVVRIDVTGEPDAPADALMIMGKSGQVYMTQQSLYIAALTYEYVSNGDTGSTWNSWISQWQARTDIYKISLDADHLAFAAAGQVPGSINDQFSMDEYDGRLRIVTTTGHLSNSASHLFVLEPQGPTLELVGVLTGMGIGERVYATRFVGDRAYVVTFRQTDPLHVIDLSDPTKPRLAGVLHIPGYSSYLQPVGDHLLLGIGQDATETGRITGLQLSLFDVSDSANPRRVSQLKFETATWSYSEAQWNHKAFNYFPDQGILALSLQGNFYDLTPEGLYTNYRYARQLKLVRIDPVAGLSETAGIVVDSPIERTLRIGDNIYSVTSKGVRVASLEDPGTVIANVDRNWTYNTSTYTIAKSRWGYQHLWYWGDYFTTIDYYQPISLGVVFLSVESPMIAETFTMA